MGVSGYLMGLYEASEEGEVGVLAVEIGVGGGELVDDALAEVGACHRRLLGLVPELPEVPIA